jgi:hypothetical protein
MQASDFSVSFRYGATDYPYSPTSPHQGNDQVMPVGIPVVTGGLLIGYSGNTGDVVPRPTAANPNAGAHLHTGKFDAAGKAYDPGISGDCFRLAGGFIHSTGEDSKNGKWVRVFANGYYWPFCHLSRIVVAKNQQVTGPAGGRGAGALTEGYVMNDEDAKEVGYRLPLYREPENDKVWRSLVGKNPREVAVSVRGSAEYMTNNHILKVAFPAAMRGLIELQKQLTDEQAKKQVEKIIERCTVDLSAMPADDANLLTKIVAFFTRKK